MKYQLSGSFHTLTHWQSGGIKREEDTLAGYTVQGGTAIIPPLLIGGKVAIFPYGMKAKGYDYTEEKSGTQILYRVYPGNQPMNVKPVYGVIKSYEGQSFGTTDKYVYASIYWEPLTLHFEGIPADKEMFGDLTETGATLYETRKGQGTYNGTKINTYLATDKTHNLVITNSYTGLAIIPVIQVRFYTSWEWYKTIDQIPQWVRDVCKDETADIITKGYGYEIKEVTEEIENEVKKMHPDWFSFPLDLSKTGMPLAYGGSTILPIYNLSLSLLGSYDETDGGKTDVTSILGLENRTTAKKFIKDRCPFLGMKEYTLGSSLGSFIVGDKDGSAKIVKNSTYQNGLTGRNMGLQNDIERLSAQKFIVTDLDVIDNFTFFK